MREAEVAVMNDVCHLSIFCLTSYCTSCVGYCLYHTLSFDIEKRFWTFRQTILLRSYERLYPVDRRRKQGCNQCDRLFMVAELQWQALTLLFYCHRRCNRTAWAGFIQVVKYNWPFSIPKLFSNSSFSELESLLACYHFYAIRNPSSFLCATSFQTYWLLIFTYSN